MKHGNGDGSSERRTDKLAARTREPSGRQESRIGFSSETSSPSVHLLRRTKRVLHSRVVIEQREKHTLLPSTMEVRSFGRCASSPQTTV